MEVEGYKINPIPENVLYVVDGVEITEETFKVTVRPEEISSMTVLKGDRAVALYGEKGKNGVILVKTKKAESNPPKKVSPTKL